MSSRAPRRRKHRLSGSSRRNDDSLSVRLYDVPVQVSTQIPSANLAKDGTQRVEILIDHQFPIPPRTKKKKGRGINKGLKPPKDPADRKMIKLTETGEFEDVKVPRNISALVKRCFDGPFFTFERVPQDKVLHIYDMFKSLYQWQPVDAQRVWNAFLNSLRTRWSDNLRDARLAYEADGQIPFWIPEHVFEELKAYWNSDEFKARSERGKKNRAAGERVTHTTGSISFSVNKQRLAKENQGVPPKHQESYKYTHTYRRTTEEHREGDWIHSTASGRHETYVTGCTSSHGPDDRLWPDLDANHWANAIGGVKGPSVPGIGSQVDPATLGFKYRKRAQWGFQLHSIMMADMAAQHQQQMDAMKAQLNQLNQVVQSLLAQQGQQSQAANGVNT